MKSQDFWNGTVGIFYVAVFLGILAFIAYLLYGPGITITVPDFFGGNKHVNVESPFGSAVGTLFECEGEKALKAEFLDGKVVLTLSDGRQITLPQVVSGSGARYANADESFVFWNKGDSASVQEGEEDGTTTYANCAARP